MRGKSAHLFTVGFLLVMAVLFFKHGQWTLWYLPGYNYYSVSDWLINYEGGFVRRGLMGQLLYWAYQARPFNVRVFILSLTLVFSPLLLFLLLRVFRKERWSPVVIFTSCCLGITFFCSDVRRDYLVLIIVYFLFMFLLRWQTLPQRKNLYASAFIALSVVLMLTYEPAVFFTLPLLLFITWRSTGKKGFLLFLPAVFACVAVFASKGNADMVRAICLSWEPCFERYPFEGIEDIIGVQALGWKPLDTFIFHLRLAYMGTNPSWLNIPLILYMLASTYYLVVRADLARLPYWPSDGYDSRGISNVLLFQTLSMLPMFTVLSCDWGRNIMLCTISSFFALHFFPGIATQMPHLSKVSAQLLKTIDRYRLLRSPYFYLFVALTTPIPLAFAPTLNDSVLGILLSLLSNI